MQQCPACHHNLPDRKDLVYCPKCLTQLWCKNKSCKALLELDAVGCVVCGTPIGEAGITTNTSPQTHHINGIANLPINTIEFVEASKSYSRSFKAALTNEVGTSIGSALITAIGERTSIVTSGNDRAKRQNIHPVETQQLPLFELNQSHDEALVDVSSQHTLASAKSKSDADKLRQVFRYNGEQLRLMETRLKAHSKLDAASRLTYLFLYAHELEGRPEISRTVLNEELKKVGLYDSNASNWINHSPELFREEDRVGLQKSGREEAQKILEEVLDSNIPNKWTLNPAGGTRGAKSNTKGDDNSAESSVKNGSRKNNGFSKTVESWVTAWKALPLSIDRFAAINDCSTLEKGIFGLWAVGKATEDFDLVVSCYMLEQFLYLAFGVKVNQRTLEQNLQENAGKGSLIKVQRGFKLLPSGISEAEKMADRWYQ